MPIPRSTPPPKRDTPAEPLQLETFTVRDLDIVFSSGKTYVVTLNEKDSLLKSSDTIEIDFEDGTHVEIQRQFVAYESLRTRTFTKPRERFKPDIGKD